MNDQSGPGSGPFFHPRHGDCQPTSTISPLIGVLVLYVVLLLCLVDLIYHYEHIFREEEAGFYALLWTLTGVLLWFVCSPLGAIGRL